MASSSARVCGRSKISRMETRSSLPPSPPPPPPPLEPPVLLATAAEAEAEAAIVAMRAKTLEAECRYSERGIISCADDVAGGPCEEEALIRLLLLL